MSDSQITLTREDFYKLIWTEPRTQLAKRLGISDVGLAKRCRKLKIPMPGLGDWAKIQAGHPVRQPPLPPMVDARPLCFPGPVPDTVQVAQAQASLPTQGWSDDSFSVPDTLHGAHSIVRATRDALRGSATDKYGRISIHAQELISMNVSPAQLNRALRIAEGLFRIVEKLGGSVSPGSGWYKGAVIRIEGVDLRIVFEESAKRFERELSPREKEDHRRHPSLYSGIAYEWRASGILKIKIDEYLPHGTQLSWSDRKHLPLQDNLRDIVEGILVAGALKKKRKEEGAEEQRRTEELQRRRDEAEQIRREEEKRFRALLREAHQWELSRKVAAYADAIEQAAVATGQSITRDSELGSWLLWVRQKAHQLDSTGQRVSR
jgi:hypothetical protein